MSKLGALTEDNYREAAKFSDLDDGLLHLMKIADPEDKHDLGGLAGVHFSGAIDYQAPADNGMTSAPAGDAWPYLYDDERRMRLRTFFDQARSIIEGK